MICLICKLTLIPFVNDAWEYFYTEILNIINKHAPLRVIKVKGSHSPWVSGDLISLFKQRDKVWKKDRHTRDVADWEAYKCLRNICTTQIINAKSNYYKNSLLNHFNNSRHFWKQMNNLLGKSDSEQMNMFFNNEMSNDPTVVANAFSPQFSLTPQVQCPPHSVMSSPNQPARRSFSFREVSPTDVQQAISGLSSNSGAGPDGNEAKFIKLASHVLSSSLSYLFNLSFTTCVVPFAWKCARVIPLHKEGDLNNLNN